MGALPSLGSLADLAASITPGPRVAWYLSPVGPQSLLASITSELAAAGTVTNVKEASLWLSYTYLYVRMLRNPLAYGVGWEDLTADPRLDTKR